MVNSVRSLAIFRYGFAASLVKDKTMQEQFWERNVDADHAVIVSQPPPPPSHGSEADEFCCNQLFTVAPYT